LIEAQGGAFVQRLVVPVQTGSTLCSIVAPVEAELALVEEAIRRESDAGQPFVRSLFAHALQFGGKRIRPALVLLAARGLSGVTERHIRLATVVELLHSATLVHDDVLDGALLRRRTDTLHVRFGNEASVLFGDYLFSRAFILCTEAGTPRAWSILTRAAQETCLGELAQTARKFAYDLGEEDYFQIVRRKTGALFGAAAELATVDTDGGEAAAPRLVQYGLHLGTAFQMVDDCLDLIGEEREMGKTLGTDLEKGKVTLPVIRLHAVTPAAERPALREFLMGMNASEESRRRLRDRLRESGAIEYAFARARRCVEEAKAALDGLPDSFDRIPLLGLADHVVSRRA
jgi:octaprenyl-diphosphate synthase